MADQKLLELPEITQTSGSNFTYVLDDPTSGKLDRKIQIDNLIYSRRWHPDRPPASPTAYDDEFELPALQSKWTVISDTANTKYFGSMYPSWLMCKFTGNQTYGIQQQYVQTGDFSITLKGSFPVQSNYAGIRMYAYDSAKTNAVAAVYEYSGGVKLQLGTMDSSTWNWNRTVLTLAGLGFPSLYLHLQKSGTNWFVASSLDGYTFLRQSNYSKTMSVEYIFIELNMNGQTIAAFAGFDWFRVNWLNHP